ncbi:hypothetical protein ACJ72_05415 [Emergomyces africanus]|uniref:HNH nuclease domain-containing protein n=1 Tax=Emergomyces africanus TaxID=1955775 RepID=A0A1B7NU09_9EURO|nr:hypothetical protein ACJ72_05415 [Emergomyces africanus]
MARHRHQVSLENIINFSGPQPLAADQRARAKRRFYSIIIHFRAAEASDAAYSRPLLVRYMYEYSRSELSQDTFLRAFFESMGLDIAVEHDPDFESEENQLSENLTSFADFLLDNFFIPLKASGQRTSQPSPAHLSAIQRAQGRYHEYLPTPDRISFLRGVCLIRDHHRCVISRQFDQKEAMIRVKQQGESAQDDEGNQLRGQSCVYLEVAHIIPHSLTQSDADGQLSDSKKAALMILNMFDCDVSHMIDDGNIDRPFNAMSLTPSLHTDFGNFLIFLNLDQSIEPPSPRLLAIHRAIAYILHLSGAGEYIDKILQDMEEMGAREGGSTELGRLVTLRFGGWFDRAPVRTRTRPPGARHPFARLPKVTFFSIVARAEPLINGYTEGCQMWKLPTGHYYHMRHLLNSLVLGRKSFEKARCPHFLRRLVEMSRGSRGYGFDERRTFAQFVAILFVGGWPASSNSVLIQAIDDVGHFCQEAQDQKIDNDMYHWGCQQWVMNVLKRLVEDDLLTDYDHDEVVSELDPLFGVQIEDTYEA